MLDESTLAIYRRMRLPLVACRGKGYAFSGLYMPTPYSTLCEWPRQVGLLTGYPFYGGKLLVMDVDPRNHGDESLARLIAKFGPLPYTAHQRTPSGGDHYFFVVPADLEIPQDLPDLPGIDVFSQQNHHILIAPSTFNRNSYSWEVPIWDTVGNAPNTCCISQGCGRESQRTSRRSRSSGERPPGRLCRSTQEERPRESPRDICRRPKT